MLFLIMDPLGNLPVFLSILRHIDPKRRRKVMMRELLFSLVIMMAFLFVGQQILNFLNLRQEAVNTSATVRFHVAADGTATVELSKPTQNLRLNRLLLDTLKNWRFFPAMKDGKPVASVEELVIKIDVQ